MSAADHPLMPTPIPTTSVNEPMAASPLILAVEDEPASLMILKATLQKAGFTMLTASSGEEAMHIFMQQQPDLILMDVTMPGMSGIEACQKIRQQSHGQDVPIIMTTGMDDVTSINQAYEAGATDFIHKPINWALVPHRINYALRAARALAKLRENEVLLANAQRLAQLGSWELDREYKAGKLIKDKLNCSDQIYRLTGKNPEVDTMTLSAFFNHISRDESKALFDNFKRGLARDGKFQWEYVMRTPEGIERNLQGYAEVVLWNSERRLISGTLQDVTRQRHAEAKIMELTYRDGLTGLANRTAFNERLDSALFNARRKKQLVGVMYLDLDRFKRINDTLGHSVGNQLLQGIGQRLHDCLRAEPREELQEEHEELQQQESFDPGQAPHTIIPETNNTDVVARLGGDEFVILLSSLRSVQQIIRVSERVLESFKEPFELEGHRVYATPSIGAAVYPHDGEDAGTLLKNADTAMYHAKEAGRNNFKFYSPSMNLMASSKLAIETHLHGAIERNELRLVYQPQVCARSAKIIGFEALLRWQHPTLGNVSPVQFIPIAEETGLIIQIGQWVMREACRFQRGLVDHGLPPVRIAVNVSRQQFRQPDFLKMVERTVANSGINPNYLELEITESSVIHNEEEAIKLLRKLKALGLRLALDDFGTGYSSLSYLQQFPLDLLKIDRSFISRLDEKNTDADKPGTQHSAAIAIAIITMAHSLGMSVIAEGVETVTQLEILRSHQCDEIQGYYYAPPLAADAIVDMLIKQPYQHKNEKAVT